MTNEEKAINYLNDLGDKRIFMTNDEVDLTNLVIKYKKAIKEIIKFIELSDMEDLEKEEIMYKLKGVL